MNSAVCSQSSVSITAFTMSVTQFCAWQVLSGGWSESSKRGVTHVTAGRSPSRMSRTIRSTGRMRSERHRSVWYTPAIPFSAFQKYPGWNGAAVAE
jgi:hypothetical protein